MSVRLSVTLCIVTAKDIVKLLYRCGSAITLVFWPKAKQRCVMGVGMCLYTPMPNSKGNPFSRASKIQGWEKLRFSTEIAVYLANGKICSLLLLNVNTVWSLYRRRIDECWNIPFSRLFVLWNTRSHDGSLLELSFSKPFVPWNIRYLDRSLIHGNFRCRERIPPARPFPPWTIRPWNTLDLSCRTPFVHLSQNCQQSSTWSSYKEGTA